MEKLRKSFNLEAIIGNVSQKYNESLKDKSKTNHAKLQKDFSNTYQIQGLKIHSKVNKVPESFKIEANLKLVVENVVQEARNYGHNVSKGHIYNLLLKAGLEKLKKR